MRGLISTSFFVSTLALFLLCNIIVVTEAQWNNAVFANLLTPPPVYQAPSQQPSDVKFYLFRNPDDEEEKHEILYEDDLSLEASGYNKSLPLVLLLHGVLSNHLTISDVQQVKNTLLSQRYPANIIMVDYGRLAISKLPFLLSPLSILKLLITHLKTDVIANRVAEFVIYLMRADLLSGPENLHMIGFSLGAHIAGTAGRHLYDRSGRKVKRITGLDPSPQFPLRSVKLDESDADFVDVTLTSLGAIANVIRVGHVQYYLNGGGPHQPNCPNFAPFTETYCSHTTAVFYFSKSIKKRGIKACKCDLTCKNQPAECNEPIVYGMFASETDRGKFYVGLD